MAARSGLKSSIPSGDQQDDRIAVGHRFDSDEAVMQYALQIARLGIGHVEPNPAVGAVIVDDGLRLIAAGFHQKCGAAHAEVNAISAAGDRTARQQLFVTLEPCSHHGKTPPCADAVIAAGFRRIVVGCQDPAPHVAGQGTARIRAAGIHVDVGLCESAATQLIAPFRKLQLQQLPWIHAKWAMTLDGRIATRTGHSQWISNAAARTEVHQLRGRMDGIITGAGTLRADNPLLTARPPGPRVALRIVVDADGRAVKLNSQLMSTVADAPVLVCVRTETADKDHCNRLRSAGAEVFETIGGKAEQLHQLITELGRRKCTHVLLEAGPGLLGGFFDAALVDEVHVYVAPKIVGGLQAVSPVGGVGLETIPSLDSLIKVQTRTFETNVLIEGFVRNSNSGM